MLIGAVFVFNSEKDVDSLAARPNYFPSKQLILYCVTRGENLHYNIKNSVRKNYSVLRITSSKEGKGSH